MRVAAAGVNPVDWKVRARRRLPRRAAVHGRLGRRRDGGGARRRRHGLSPWETASSGCRASPGRRPATPSTSPRPRASSPGHPRGLSDVEAAALPLAGLTAWQALVETADVQPGQRVLVLGAAGGVGHLAVQIAKARGAYVIGTARVGQARVPRRAGRRRGDRLQPRAGRGRRRRRRRRARPSGASEASPALRTLRDGGLFIVVPSAAGLERSGGRRGTGARRPASSSSPTGPAWRRSPGSSRSGELRPHVDADVPARGGGRAHEAGETGRTQGKLVL